MSNALTHINRNEERSDEFTNTLKNKKEVSKIKLVPALRFKEFEEGWHSEFFESFLSDKNALAYGVLQPGEDVEGGVPMLRTVDLNDFGLKGNTVILRIPKKMDLQYKRTKLAGGELIISVMGTLGRTVIVPPEWKGWNVNRALAVARLNESIDKWFLIQTLHTPKFKKKVVEEALGSAQKRINLGDLKEYKFTLPSLPEQQKIASFLSAVDEKIQQLTKKKALLEQYKKGVMQQLFPGQLRFKDENGNPYPDWEEKRLIDITKINQGLQIAISERFLEPVEDGYFYITNEFLRAKSEKAFYIKSPPASVICDADDILMTRTGNTGQVVTGVNGAFHNNFFKIKYQDHCEKWFLYYFLTSPLTQHNILKLAGTSTIPDLNHGDFYKIKIDLPSIEEQSKISTVVKSIDTKIEAVHHQITQTQTFKKGLLQQMFVAA